MSKTILGHTLEYWGDLEHAYINKLGSLNKIRAKKNLPLLVSRLDFLKALVGYEEKDNRVRLNYIKSRLAEEVGTYSPEELQVYSNLMEVFQGVTLLLCENTVEEITTFNNFAMEMRGDAATANSNQKALDPTFFERLQPIKTCPNIPISSTLSTTELYCLTGQLGNTHMLVDGEVKALIASDSLEDSLFLIADCQSDEILAQADSGNKFAKRLIEGMRCLSAADKLKFQTLFLDKNYFKVKENGGVAEIKFGDKKVLMKISPTNRYEVLGTKIKLYTGKIATKVGEINTVLID